MQNGGREMLVFDLHAIGNKLMSIRKRMGMTQAEVAELKPLLSHPHPQPPAEPRQA